MRVPYTYLEVEAIDRDYDEQVPIKIIAENVNRDFHNDEPVRNVNSVRYVINKIYNSGNGAEWYRKLEEDWLCQTE